VRESLESTKSSGELASRVSVGARSSKESYSAKVIGKILKRITFYTHTS